MALKVHGWREKMQIGERGQRIVSAFLRVRGYLVRDVSLDPDEQMRDIDFYVKPPRSQRWLSVEIKTDSYKSGCIFLELSSSAGNPGCVFKSRAQVWAYWLPNLDTLLFINLPALQLWVLNHAAEYARKPVHSSRGQSRWSVDGIVVPIQELVNAGVARETSLGVLETAAA